MRFIICISYLLTSPFTVAAAPMNPAMNHAASMNPAMNNMADNTGADYGKYSSLLLLSIYLLHCRI